MPNTEPDPSPDTTTDEIIVPLVSTGALCAGIRGNPDLCNEGDKSGELISTTILTNRIPSSK